MSLYSSSYIFLLYFHNLFWNGLVWSGTFIEYYFYSDYCSLSYNCKSKEWWNKLIIRQIKLEFIKRDGFFCKTCIFMPFDILLWRMVQPSSSVSQWIHRLKQLSSHDYFIKPYNLNLLYAYELWFRNNNHSWRSTRQRKCIKS